MKKLYLILLLALTQVSSYAQNVTLGRQGDALQLHVDGQPFLILGGEL